MDRGLLIALILLVSTLWPFAYAEPAQSQPAQSQVSFCSLGKLGVLNLSYSDVTAIQGIVTQDVLSSADMYKTRKAMKELGSQPETQSSQLADKYKLYFVGPDGEIKYSDIIRNKLTSAQDWLLNTTIFGRVEYGGRMGEDLLVCPDLPTNQPGMCNYKAGDKIQDVYSRDWNVGVETPSGKAGQAYFNMVSNFVQTTTNANDVFGSVDIGMSRVRSHKYVVSLGAPAGSQLFVIPKTYMYFMSQLKNLATFEAFAQGALMVGGILGAIRNIKTGKEFVTNKGKALEGSKDELKRLTSGVRKFKNGGKDVDTLENAVKEVDSISDLGAGAKYADVERAIENVIHDKVDDVIDRMGLAPETIKNINNKQGFVAALLAGDEEEVGRILKASGIKNIDPAALTKQYAGKFVEYLKGETPEDIGSIEVLYESVENDPFFKYKKSASVVRQYIDKINDAKTKEEKKALMNELRSKEELQDIYGFLQKESVAYDKALSGKGVSWMTRMGLYGTPKDEEVAKEMGELLSKSKPSSTFGSWFFGKMGISPSEFLGIHAGVRAAGAVGEFFRGYLRSILFVGRPIVAAAWGLQLFSEIFMMKGYLELSPPGLTMEWDKNTTGGLFTKNSYIIVKGVPSAMPGMWSSGELGSLGAQQLGEFLLSIGISPPLAGKYSNFGNYLIFGYDFNENAYNKVLKVEKEGQPTGITRITRARDGYLLRMANWKEEGVSVLEDPATTTPVGNNSRLTSVAMFTDGADIYGYIYGNPAQIKTQFPVTWTFAEKIGDFGFLSNSVIAGTLIYFWPTVPRLLPVIGAPMMTGISKTATTGAKSLVIAKATDMKSLENCVKTGKCKRPSCEQVCAKCEADLGVMSGYLITSGVVQTAIDWTAQGGGVLAPVSLGLGFADMVVLEGGIPTPFGGIKLFKGKLERTQECMSELLTCNERDFIIVAGQTIKDPSVIKAEQEQAMKIKGLPGLDQIPVDKLLAPLTNLTSPINLDQEQLNVHGEFYNATGRIALRSIYYLHIIDATIDFLANSMPFHMCGLTENDTIKQCVDIQGDTLKYGNTTVKNGLIPFKWIDTELPAMVIPNTGVYMNVSDSKCSIFSVSPESLQPTFNPDITSKFTSLNFSDLARTFGTLRVINLDEGSIYPTTNVDGKLRLELDLNDGSYQETNGPVWLESNGKLVFTNLKNETRELGFRSAVFAGGVIVKKGNAIYVLPRYFRPSISGIEWRKLVGTKPFASLNGQSPVTRDQLGNILGINAKNTKIPGADKLGIITAVSGYKDLNGDGKIEDNEKVGWRFYKVGNKSYFDLYYKGKKETYNGSQVEVEPDGTIKVYEKGKPHTQAYLLRQISTRVDDLGRTLMTIKDGKGNDLIKDALLTWIKGTGGSIQYNPDTNNYVFVNGQPIELNNEFKTNGFNAVTGMPDPPLLQPSSVHGTKPWEKAKSQNIPPIVPTVPESDIPIYVLAIIVGFLGIYLKKRKGIKQS